ncbi:hypothetical protein [Curtobacterium sp. MCSS17_015]|uniref:hypothetical protein n=1 Tax=Curtobacterium sp. MCSS17_015 TaxID=2175666 RepID=UPI0011B683F1|nr:hypothetical protein [Curtobacterium sp. MCSS17_015]WIB25920.1 hypothetical protein DEJ18_12815 [Curtobacterium sp. MCSS17_015]
MQRMRNLPEPALMVALAVLCAVFTFLASFLTRPDAVLAERLISTTVGAVVFGVGFGLVISWMRKRGGGAVLDRSFQRALRTGEVPPDVDRTAWRQALELHQKVHRWLAWVGPVVAALAVGLGIWLAQADSPAWWIAVALYAAFMIITVVAMRRALLRMTAVLAELDRRDTQPVAR